MTHRPPTSPLFPYTTLFRSRKPTRAKGKPRALALQPSTESIATLAQALMPGRAVFALPGTIFQTRSEEHTSELQSLRHLVCRLLLEKKKKKQQATIIKHQHL